MPTADTPFVIGEKSQEKLMLYYKQCQELNQHHWNIRESLRQIDLSYIREEDWTKVHREAEAANRAGDANRFQNITVPLIMPQVESAVVYQSSVFLTGTPMFGVVAPPQYVDQGVALESVIHDNSIKYGYTRNFVMFFRDGFKYNLSYLECSWDRRVVPSFDTQLEAGKTEGQFKELLYQGNRIKRLDPYNVFTDIRVPPAELHTRGEFAGYTDLISRIELKDFVNKLPTKIVSNVVKAFETPTLVQPSTHNGESHSYYLPQINPHALLDAGDRDFIGTNWMTWAELDDRKYSSIRYQNHYELTTFYAKILPSDFNINVPAKNTPQIWKFYIVNHQVIIYAERLTNAHGFLPILCGQPNEDGLQYQTKSLAANVQPFQYLASALVNSAVHARRRAVSDRVIYNPSIVSDKHMNSPNPSAKIPMRPSAFNRSPSEAVYQFPFRDDQSGIAFSEMNQIQAMANMVTGFNPVRQGQFVKGNKTRTEFSEVMANANGRDQLVAMMYESQIMTPLKEMIKTNILQYQGPNAFYNQEQQEVIQVDPVKLRKAVMEFKVSDGLIPSEKIMDAGAFTAVLQTIQAVPQLGVGYNVLPMFSYLMKTQGAKIKDFEKSKEQVAYEQSVGAWNSSVAVIAEQLKGLPVEEQKQLLDSIPPMPTPQQFNYNPQTGAATNGQTTQ